MADPPIKHIEELLQRLFKGEITPDEKETLAAWIQESGEQERFMTLVQQSWENFESHQTIPGDKAAHLLESVLHKSPLQEEARVVSIKTRHRRIYRAMAAAVLLLLIGAALVFRAPPSPAPAKMALKSDVAPPSASNAILTLAGGKKIVLDSAGNGELTTQGKTDIVKLGDGQIAYQAKGAAEATVYNTLTVPRGSRIATLTLSDGSKVWLNAGSSLTYPVVFSGNQRKVSVTGEIYFEVAPHAGRPFIVTNGSTEIAVLGTHFNVNAYEDEEDLKVTLLEGAVKVSGGQEKALLTPGQMAVLQPATFESPSGITAQQTNVSLKVLKDVDVEQVMAWKNGQFNFSDVDIRTVMRELARWYGVDVQYQDNVTEKFYMETDRNTNVSNILKILETTGGVHFQITGDKIIVMK
jgi:transmembrane sensor